MKVSTALLSYLRCSVEPSTSSAGSWTRPFCRSKIAPLRRQFQPLLQRRLRSAPADDPNFISLVDNPAQIIRYRRKHGAGIIVLGKCTCPFPSHKSYKYKDSQHLTALIPITAFILGSWQVQRLGWKTELIARFEDRLVRDPLPLPPTIDPAAIHEFDYRRVYARGRFRHDQEMLIGPRLHDGEDGYLVITPLERSGGASKVLVNRGWVSKAHKVQTTRAAAGMPLGEVTVEGLLREPWKKNLFTPDNKPEAGEFYFPDVEQMAGLSGSVPVWIEATMRTFFFPRLDALLDVA